MKVLEQTIKKITTRRKLLRYSQKDMAELTGLSERTIRSIENGEGVTSIASFIKILDVLGLELNIQFKPTHNEAGQSSV